MCLWNEFQTGKCWDLSRCFSAWEVPCLFTPYQIIPRICEEINSLCLAHIFIRCLGKSWRFLAIILEVVRSVRLDNSTLLPFPNYHEPPIAIPTESLNLKSSFEQPIMPIAFERFPYHPQKAFSQQDFPSKKSWEVPVSVATFMGSLSSAAWRIIITPAPRSQPKRYRDSLWGISSDEAKKPVVFVTRLHQINPHWYVDICMIDTNWDVDTLIS